MGERGGLIAEPLPAGIQPHGIVVFNHIEKLHDPAQTGSFSEVANGFL